MNAIEAPARYVGALAYRYVIRPTIYVVAACSWLAAASLALVLYPTAFLVACALCALVVLRHRAVARRAVRNATIQQLAFARIVREGGARR